MDKFIALIIKEWLLTRKQKHLFLSLLLFSTLVIMLLYFGLEALEYRPPVVVPSIIWLAIVFGGTLQLNRTYDFERDEDVLCGLGLIRGIATPFYLSKLLVNLSMLIAIAAYSLFIGALLFTYPLFSEFGKIFLPLTLGIIGLAAVGTTFSTMFIAHHKKDILLPTIFYPLIAPLSVAVIKSMLAAPADAAAWIKILIAFDVIYITASLLVFDKMIEG